MATVTERKRKRGRPVKSVKKEVRACVRFTHPEYFILIEKAAEAGVTPSSFLRQLAIHTQVKARLTEEQRQWVRKLIGMENNINQIAKVCHQDGAVKAMVYFQGIRGDLDLILKLFKE